MMRMQVMLTNFWKCRRRDNDATAVQLCGPADSAAIMGFNFKFGQTGEDAGEPLSEREGLGKINDGGLRSDSRHVWLA